MGMYDCLPEGSQVKLWDCELKHLKLGDAVPSFGLPKYFVLLREGGYILVEDGIITIIKENKKYYYPEDFPPSAPCFDKYGNRVSTKADLRGMFEGLGVREDSYYPIEKGDNK